MSRASKLKSSLRLKQQHLARLQMGSGSSYPSHGMLLNHSIAPRPVLTTAETSPLNVLYYRRRASSQAIDERTARLVATAAAATDVNAVCDQSALFDRCALMWIPHSQQFCDDDQQDVFEPRDESESNAEHADRQQACSPKRCAWLASRSNALIRLSERELSLGKLPTQHQVNQAPECLPPLTAHLPVLDAIESEYAESWRAVILGDTAPPHAVPLDPTLCLCFEAVLVSGEMTVRCVTLEEIIAESSSVVAQPIAVNGHAILPTTSSEQLTALLATLQNFGNQREGDSNQASQFSFSPRCAVILNQWDSILKSLFSFVLPLLKNSRSAPSGSKVFDEQLRARLTETIKARCVAEPLPPRYRVTLAQIFDKPCANTDTAERSVPVSKLVKAVTAVPHLLGGIDEVRRLVAQLEASNQSSVCFDDCLSAAISSIGQRSALSHCAGEALSVSFCCVLLERIGFFSMGSHSLFHSTHQLLAACVSSSNAFKLSVDSDDERAAEVVRRNNAPESHVASWAVFGSEFAVCNPLRVNEQSMTTAAAFVPE